MKFKVEVKFSKYSSCMVLKVELAANKFSFIQI